MARENWKFSDACCKKLWQFAADLARPILRD